MQSDPEKDIQFEEHRQWGKIEMNLFSPLNGSKKNQPAFTSTPFSGNERNRLFIQSDGNFEDVSLVSGIDFQQDGRGFAIFDFNQDGWMDLALVSPNKPRLRIAKNQIGEQEGENSGDQLARESSFVEVHLVGGQTKPEPSSEWSSRDAIGAIVRTKIGNSSRIFQLSCGEGLSSQNTNRIHIGLGEAKQIDELIVEWPSGKTTTMDDVSRSSRITVFEKANASNDSE